MVNYTLNYRNIYALPLEMPQAQSLEQTVLVHYLWITNYNILFFITNKKLYTFFM